MPSTRRSHRASRFAGPLLGTVAPPQLPAEQPPIIEQLERWGAKEVRPDHHEDSIALLRPERIVVLVRDLRDVAVSLLEKHEIQGTSGYDQAWSREYILSAARTLVRIATSADLPAARVVRYEDFVSSDDSRLALARWLNWQLGTKVADLAEGRERPWELARHGGRITRRSIGRHRVDLAPEVRSFIEDIADSGRAYQRAFGYAG